MTLREVMQCSLDTPISQMKSDIRRVHLAMKSIARFIYGMTYLKFIKVLNFIKYRIQGISVYILVNAFQ